MKTEKIKCCNTTIFMWEEDNSITVTGSNVIIEIHDRYCTLYCSVCNKLLKTLKQSDLIQLSLQVITKNEVGKTYPLLPNFK